MEEKGMWYPVLAECVRPSLQRQVRASQRVYTSSSSEYAFASNSHEASLQRRTYGGLENILTT